MNIDKFVETVSKFQVIMPSYTKEMKKKKLKTIFTSLKITCHTEFWNIYKTTNMLILEVFEKKWDATWQQWVILELNFHGREDKPGLET